MEQTVKLENVIDTYWSLSQGERAKVRKECKAVANLSDAYMRSLVIGLKTRKNVSEKDLTLILNAIKSVNKNIENDIQNTDYCTIEESQILNQRYRALKFKKRVKLRDECCLTIDNIDNYIDLIRRNKPIPNDIYRFISQILLNYE